MLEIRIIDPALADALVGQAVDMLRQQQPDLRTGITPINLEDKFTSFRGLNSPKPAISKTAGSAKNRIQDDLRNYARNVALAWRAPRRVVADCCNIRFHAARSRGNGQFL